MHFDEDMKIVGQIKNVPQTEEVVERLTDLESAKKAKTIGVLVAQKFLQDTDITDENFTNAELLVQRRILLSFAAKIGFEYYIKDEKLSDIAQNSFAEHLKANGEEVYSTSSDIGAISFYYLAYRRDDDVERRIGQTFAMLCSHDGDPIFQELGEALYCWFLSAVKKIISENL